MSKKLLQSINIDDLLKLGFVEETDGTDDPRGYDWNIRNENFHLYVDAWFDVYISRVNPDTDAIQINADTLHELECVVDWISD